MHFSIEKISPEDWRRVSENAHLLSFGTYKPKEWDRIDYALLIVGERDLLGYVTCREFDEKTVYWQFGGTFPGTKGTSMSFTIYNAGIEWSKNKYQRIVTLIENDNLVMLKFAMKVGFRIQGIRFHQGSILLEHVLEFSNE